MSTDHKHHITPLPLGARCENCREHIAKGEARYHVMMGTFAESFDTHTSYSVYYHKAHLDPYVILMWLQTYEAVLIALSPGLA